MGKFNAGAAAAGGAGLGGTGLLTLGPIGGVAGLALGSLGGLFGDDDEPYQYPDLPRWQGAGAYEKFLEGSNLAAATGADGAANRLRNRAENILGRRPDLDVSGLDINNFDNWRTMGPDQNQAATAALVRQFRERLRTRYPEGTPEFESLVNRFKVGLAKRIEAAMKSGLIEEIDPSLKAAQEQADKNLQTAAVSATDENSLRSRIASQIRQSEAQNLQRIGSTIGLGNMSQSPAAAALAQSAGNDAARAVTSTLSDMSIKVNQLNREQSRMDTDLAARIATARYSVLNGNSKSIIEMQGDIAATIDALYARDQTLRLQREAIDAGGSSGSGAASGITGALSGASTGATIGSVVPGIGTLAGTIGGGVLGAAGGYFGAR